MNQTCVAKLVLYSLQDIYTRFKCENNELLLSPNPHHNAVSKQPAQKVSESNSVCIHSLPRKSSQKSKYAISPEFCLFGEPTSGSWVSEDALSATGAGTQTQGYSPIARISSLVDKRALHVGAALQCGFRARISCVLTVSTMWLPFASANLVR